MKVAIGTKPHDGPWGGGNRFVMSLSTALTARGHVVVHDLDAPDIDIILIVDPRFRVPHVSFGAGAALRYILFRNPDAVVVHRINECDERKGEPFINHKLVRANYIADATVFVGEWLTRLPVWQKHLRSPWWVIHNGGDTGTFNARGFEPWSGTGPIRFVTHHWGYHPMKGFDVYAALDEMMSDPEWKAKVDFTYIGQLPAGFKFRNARYVKPLNSKALADRLRASPISPDRRTSRAAIIRWRAHCAACRCFTVSPAACRNIARVSACLMPVLAIFRQPSTGYARTIRRWSAR